MTDSVVYDRQRGRMITKSGNGWQSILAISKIATRVTSETWDGSRHISKYYESSTYCRPHSLSDSNIKAAVFCKRMSSKSDFHGKAVKYPSILRDAMIWVVGHLKISTYITLLNFRSHDFAILSEWTVSKLVLRNPSLFLQTNWYRNYMPSSTTHWRIIAPSLQFYFNSTRLPTRIPPLHDLVRASWEGSWLTSRTMLPSLLDRRRWTSSPSTICLAR